jgi:4-hydroxy-tetrahydrodipicolinate synthase
MTDCIRGLWAAMSTPLDAEGGVDHAALARHGRFLTDNGCDGLVPFGTTGEGTSFSAGEKLAAVETLLKSGVPADRIALGTGCPAIPDTVALTREAMGLGLVHAMILPPYYYREVTEQGIEDAFATIIDGVGSERLRVCAYHIPQVSGVPTPAAALGRLRRRYGAIMAGVKDSTGDWESFLRFRAEAPELGALVGAEPLIARALAAGGVGTICGMVNLVPDLVRAMFAGEAGTAAMQAACGLIEQPFLPVMKSILAAQTGDAAWRAVRPPLRAADAAVGLHIARGLDALRAPRAAE